MSRVSVVVPCYGQAHFLADAIGSVLAQTDPPAELIVVNDGSPDTPALERVLAPFLDRLTYIVQENRGLSGARNSGLERCRSEYVVFLDADDRLLPSALATGARSLVARPASALVWGVKRDIDARGKPVTSTPPVSGTGAGYAELLHHNVIGPPVNVMFRRSALLAIGGFSPSVKFAEDYDVYLRLAGCHEIHYHGETVAEYRLHNANMSRNVKQMHAGVLQVLERQASRIGDDPELRAAVRQGRIAAREHYDWHPRLHALSVLVRRRKWIRASAVTALLLADYPRRLTPLLIRRVRRWLPLVGDRASGAQ